LLLLEVVLYGSVQQGKMARFLRQLVGTEIEAIWSVFLLQLGCTDKAVQQTVGMFFKALFSGWAVQLYGFDMVFKAEFVGECCEVFSHGWKL
jgi:hypothetical protein